MVSAMSSAHRRNRGPPYNENDDGGASESNKPIKSLSSRNLRRRHNATISGSNGERKQDGESDVNGRTARRGSRGFPKSLTPFVHLRDTTAMDAEFDTYNNTSRSNSPKPTDRQEEDVEAQGIQNRTISYMRENSMHASFLTNDSGTDFNNSGQISNDSSKSMNKPASEKKENMLKGPPSVGSVERSKSFRRDLSYDTENNDEIVNSDDSRQTETVSGDKGKATDPDSFCGKVQKSRRIVGRFVNNEYIQLLILLLIFLNGILLGISTIQWVKTNPDIEKTVDTIDKVFLVIFTIEILMQLYYYSLALFLDAWLCFDLAVVVISWVGVGLPQQNNDYQVLRAFRIFRISRLVTRVKPLRDLVLALGEVLPRMYAIVLLLVVVFYVFAVMFTEQFSTYDLEYNYFTSLHDSLLSCFQMMTMEWVDICRPLMEVHGYKYAWISIVAFVMLAGFIVFNLIVAVVVEAVASTEEAVRHLDGIESNSPASKLAEAEERVDLLMSHLNEMMEQQEQIQFMLETMAGELLHLETERMKAKYRENRLREEINRRIECQKKAEEDKVEEKQPNDVIKKMSMQFLHKIEAQKAARKKEEEEAAAAASASSDHESVAGQSTKQKKKRRNSLRSGMSRDGSGKSIGTHQSGDSGQSIPDQIDSPNQRSTVSKQRTAGSMRASSQKGKPLAASKSVGSATKSISKSIREESRGSVATSDNRKKAIGNWKKLLAVQKDFDL